MTKAEQLYQEGYELEQQGKPEEAFQKYEQAAAMNDTDAMIGIARLYLSGETLSRVVSDFRLVDEEYQDDSVAFMVENGEKEYSFEVASIEDGRVDVLWRYTIGGSEQVRYYFKPELISMELKE